MKAQERKDFVNALLDNPARCEVHIRIWHPKKAELNWLLEIKELNVDIHVDIPVILNFYDGRTVYSGSIVLAVHLHDEDEDYLRKHPKLKLAYEKYDSNKELKGGE